MCRGLLVLLAVHAVLGAAGEGGEEEWSGVAAVREYDYTVRIKGAVAGVMSMKLYEREGVYRSVEAMEAEVDRGNDKVTLRFKTVVEEDKEGRVLRAGYKQKMAQQEISMDYDYVTKAGEGKVAVVSVQGGQRHESEAPGPTGPEVRAGRIAMLRQVEEGLREGKKELNFVTVKPEMGPTPVDVKTKLVAVEEEAIRGLSSEGPTSIPVSKWTTTVTGISLLSSEWYHQQDDREDGMPAAVMVHYSVDSPLGKLEADFESKEAAQEAMDKEEKRPELVHSAYIPLERAVKKLWDGKGKVVYRVTTKSGERPEMPEEGYQMVTAEGEEEEEEEEEDEDEGRKKEKKNSVLVTVDLGKGERVAVEDKKYLESFLAPTAMVDGSDEEVQKLAQRVVQKLETYHGPPSPRVLAKGAWAETKRTIKLSNLATGFASASETARTKTGDCSEYAVLLAAILRALGLPSRTCSGLVYLEERDGRANFGWHMWSQVLLPSQEEGVYYWQDLDATLPIPFSLGHILLGTSAMSDAEAHTAELKLVSLIGNLNVEVVG